MIRWRSFIKRDSQLSYLSRRTMNLSHERIHQSLHPHTISDETIHFVTSHSSPNHTQCTCQSFMCPGHLLLFFLWGAVPFLYQQHWHTWWVALSTYSPFSQRKQGKYSLIPEADGREVSPKLWVEKAKALFPVPALQTLSSSRDWWGWRDDLQAFHPEYNLLLLLQPEYTSLLHLHVVCCMESFSDGENAMAVDASEKLKELADKLKPQFSERAVEKIKCCPSTFPIKQLLWLSYNYIWCSLRISQQ